ncbi:hypothetical protein VaNZ11_010634 [Volvox africanus]|uniref:RING-type domain-containing protein n=1 Tax=Volvox africanus TaxID=51714 RepID=A0ABQ5SB29_9CHLO|nr:hypothetical protein VaNZ11_010634 [Volvox africanus]
MGNNQSLPEKVLSAVQRNDVCALQALLSNLNPSGSINDPALRTAVLEYKDKNGRTPLLVAAAKNHYQVLQQLILLGANVHYINPSRDSVGSALHEAAARRHEATVELLLSAGASPFTANAAGRTALDEAVLSGNTGVVRAIEKYAEFSGIVAFKTRTMGGLSSKYKARWAVMMPYFPFGRGREGSSASASGNLGRSCTEMTPKTRRCLWLYKDKFSAAPRCRLWVDGAAVLTNGPAGTEGTLRLHTSHGEPIGDLVASFSHGYCVAFRPADMTPSATSAYHRLVVLLNGSAISGTQLPPQQQQQQQQQAVAAMSAGPPPVMHYPAAGSLVSNPNAVLQPPVQLMPVPTMLPNTGQTPSPSRPYYPVMLPVAAHGAGVAGVSSFIRMSSPPPPPQQVSTSELAVTPPPSSSRGQSLLFPGTAGHCPVVLPPTLHTQRQPLPAAAGTMPAAAHVQSAQGDVIDVSEPGVDGQVVVDMIVERMAALPGESDEAFAMRLASAISASSGGNSQRPLHPQKHFRAEAPSPARSAAQAASDLSTQSTQRLRFSTGEDVSPSLPRANSDQHNIPGPYPPSFDVAGGERGPSGHSQQVRPAGGLAAGQREQYNTSGSGTSGCDNTSFMAHVPPSSCGSRDMEPSAPPADPFAASTARSAPRQPVPPEPEPECVICLNAPREVGFLHGDSVHCCVCRECSKCITAGDLCPLCRQPVERVLGVY